MRSNKTQIQIAAPRVGEPAPRAVLDTDVRPVDCSRVVVLDCTDPQRQYHWDSKVNGQGEFSTEWFEINRLYLLHILDEDGDSDDGLGYLRWDGREIVRTSELFDRCPRGR